MVNGKILYAMVDKTCVLKFLGSIAYNISPGFDRFLQRITHDTTIDSFVIDLTETLYIDSTNLGLLARLHEFSLKQSTVPPTLISNRENINEVIFNIGFSNIFNIVECVDENCTNLNELPQFESTPDKLAPIILKAHRELVKLNENNKELFMDIVKYLEQDTDGNSFY